MNLNNPSRIYILEENIADEIFSELSKSQYSIKINNYKPNIPNEIEKQVAQNWDEFNKNNSVIAKDNITYFFNKYDRNKNCDYVFANKFRYIQSFGRSAEFDKFSSLVAANNMTALSSICLIITSDNKLVFGIKENMDDKISGFSGYISEEFVRDDSIDIYDYLISSIKNELNISKQNIEKIIRIGQTFCPNIVDVKQKLNNKVYNNVFLIYLNTSKKNIKQGFRESFQFKKFFFVTPNEKELFDLVINNEEIMSIHCIAAIYNYLIFSKANHTAEKLKSFLKCEIISKSNVKIGSDNTAEIIKKLKIFKWGLIGNSNINQYSVAPDMWKELFSFLNYPVNYFVINENNETVIKEKIKYAIKDQSFIGCNIAMPWKQLAFKTCDTINDDDKKLQVINTLVLQNKLIEGYNTDGQGLIHAIEQKVSLKDKVVLIIGAGGACQSLPLHLFNRDIKSLYICDIINERSNDLVNSYINLYENKNLLIKSLSHSALWNVIDKVDIFINATPCGMYGYHSEIAVDKEIISNLQDTAIIVEMVYNPYKTPLLSYAMEKKYTIVEGVNMLVEQAAISFYYGFGVKLCDESKKIMKEAAKAALIER